MAEVFPLLVKHGEGARLLAGGQSLLAMLNLRLASPEILVDITSIPGLSGIKVDGEKIRIGALTTHAEIEHSPDIMRHLPLLAQAAPHIAHVTIRNAGTLGGSLALADPAAEWPACCVALDAELVITGRTGARRVKARDFFQGLYATDLRPNEVLTAVEFTIPGPQYRCVFLELAHRRGDYAIVGVAAMAKLAKGAFSDVRLAYLGAGDKPVLARKAMAAAESKKPSAETTAAATAALAKDLEPSGDVYTSAAAKMHLARVLTGRALAALAA